MTPSRWRCPICSYPLVLNCLPKHVPECSHWGRRPNEKPAPMVLDERQEMEGE